jgi:hypothetical protein
MIPHTFLIRATLRGWTVSLDGQEHSRSWSRILAEEAAMEAALDVSRSGASVEVMIQGLLGGYKTLARDVGVPSRTPTQAYEAVEERTIARSFTTIRASSHPDGRDAPATPRAIEIIRTEAGDSCRLRPPLAAAEGATPSTTHIAPA